MSDNFCFVDERIISREMSLRRDVTLYEKVRHSLNRETLHKTDHVIYLEFSGSLSIVWIQLIKSRSAYNSTQLKNFFNEISERYSYLRELGFLGRNETIDKKYVEGAIRSIFDGKGENYLLGY